MQLVVASGLVVFLLQSGAESRFQQDRPSDSWRTAFRGVCVSARRMQPDPRFDQNASRESLRLLQARLRTNPQAPELHYQLGVLYQAQNQFLKAVTEYRIALSLNKTSEDYAVALAKIFFHCDRGGKAIEVLEAFLVQNPNSVPGIRLLCRILIQHGKHSKALSLAQKYVRLDPQDSYGHYLLGLTHHGLFHYQEAQDAFEQAITLAPSFADAYFELSLLYRADYETLPLAAENLKKAIALGLNRPDVHKDLGFVLLKLGEYENAVRQLNLALKSNPDDEEPYFQLANAYRKLGMKQKAAAALVQFQSLKSAAKERLARENRIQKHYEDGEKLFNDDQLDEAYSSFMKAVEASPRMYLALYRLAQIDYIRGNDQRASGWIRQAIQLYPFEAEYHFVLASCLEQIDLTGAIDAIKTAIDLKPSDGDFHNLLGNLVFAKSDYDGAVQAYRRAIEIDPDDPAPHLNLSTALHHIGADEEAEREKNIYLQLITKKKSR